MSRSPLIARAFALGIVVVLHALVLAGFLGRWRVGLATELQSDARLSEKEAPMVASIISFGAAESRIPADRGPVPDGRGLSFKQTSIDIPLRTPVWQAEDEGSGATATPPPVAGRTGLYCEVHIHQSPQGRVQAIDFGECTGDSVWQRTLLRTIEQAAQLLDPTPGAQFPSVRTLTVKTNSLSAVMLAQQLSSVELFENQTRALLGDSSHSF